MNEAIERPSPALTPAENEEHRNRVLLKLLKQAHELNDSERELALVLLQSIKAWGALENAEKA